MNMSFPLRVFGVNMTPGLQATMTAMDHKELQYNEPLPYRPKVISTIKALLKIGHVNLQADYRYASRIAAVKIYPINDRVPMRFVDVRASYDFGRVTFQAGINNLLQYNYAPMESNLMPMRTFTAGLKGQLW